MPAIVHLLPEAETATAQFVVACPETKKAAIIDSVLDYNPASGKTSTGSINAIVSLVNEHGYEVQWILDTHVHADHITGMAVLKTIYPNATTGIGKNVKDVQKHFATAFGLPDAAIEDQFWDVLLEDDQEFSIGNLKVKCIHTPGHTPADLSFYIEDDAIFTGDSVFMPDMGTARCDFPGGSVEHLWNSLQKLLSLHPSTRVFVGHDYKPGGREYQAETTIASQKEANIHLKDGTSKDEFTSMRSNRDKELGVPRLLYPSIQFNIRGGHPPLPDPNGTSYVKIPVSGI